jgi:hypothetical protein
MKSSTMLLGRFGMAAFAAASLAIAGCASTAGSMRSATEPMTKPMHAMMAMDPVKSEQALIDRFGPSAGHLQVRDGMNGLPGPNQPVDFDRPPFVTTGLGPHGETVMYYNFDVQSTTPAPIYVLFRQGENTPVAGQLNIVDAIPGEPGYNDFWQVYKVTVPGDYLANSIGSLQALLDAGYPVQKTATLVNCPIVPEGSTAIHRLRGNDTGLHMGWYRNKIVFYFEFNEAPLMLTTEGKVPVSPIYVAFNVNPGEPNGGPDSGFKTAMGSMQTHNVVASLPGDMAYSPLWLVNPYDNMDFAKVMDLATAMDSMVLARGVATVNCPIFAVQQMAMSK